MESTLQVTGENEHTEKFYFIQIILYCLQVDWFDYTNPKRIVGQEKK